MSPQLRTVASTLVLALACAGCGGGDGGGDSPEQAGPCVVNYLEPIVILDPIFDYGNGSVLLEDIEVTDIRIDGRLADLQTLAQAPAKNMRLSDSKLICTVSPCGFGTQNGRYTFTLVKTGYRSVPIEVQAKYLRSFGVPGGCAVSYSGSTYPWVLFMQPA